MYMQRKKIWKEYKRSQGTVKEAENTQNNFGGNQNLFGIDEEG